MAAYTGTPTVLRKWEHGDRYGKAVEWCQDVTISVSSQGGATNSIGKASFGLSSIYSVQLINFTDGSAQNRGIIIWTDASIVLLGDPQVATDADRCEPLDMTGTLTFRICGKP